jgi:hypothetical protein
MTKRRTANGGIAGCAEKRADAARQYLDRFDGHDWVLLYCRLWCWRQVCLEGNDAKIVTVSSRQETREIIASQSRKPPGNREPKDAAEVGLVP